MAGYLAARSDLLHRQTFPPLPPLQALVLINLLPDFLAVLSANDRMAAYQSYYSTNRRILEPYWHNYVVDPEGPLGAAHAGWQGTTLRDYRTPTGARGSMQDELRVYGREDEPCFRCGTGIARTRVAGRGTWYCPNCQPAPTRERPA